MLLSNLLFFRNKKEESGFVSLLSHGLFLSSKIASRATIIISTTIKATIATIEGIKYRSAMDGTAVATGAVAAGRVAVKCVSALER